MRSVLLLILLLCASVFAQVQQVAVVSVAASSTPSYVCSAGDTIFKVSVTTAITGGSFSCPAAARISFVFVQDSNGHSVTPPSGFTFVNPVNTQAYATTVETFLWDGTNAFSTDSVAGSGGGSVSAVWGQVTGLIANQTDLSNALNAKAANNASTTVNGQACALGSSCTVTAAPTPHHTTHATGGSDPITPGSIGAQTALGYTPLNPANNLSDVGSASTARTNLGL